MINRFIASVTLLVAGTFCGVAQAMPGQSTVGSTVTVQNATSNIYTESNSWGNYREFGFDVNAGATDAGALTLALPTIGDVSSAGGVAGFSAYTLRGGFDSSSSGWTNITSRSVTTESFFK